MNPGRGGARGMAGGRGRGGGRGGFGGRGGAGGGRGGRYDNKVSARATEDQQKLKADPC